MWSAIGRSDAIASEEWRAGLALSRTSRPECSSKVESRIRTWWCVSAASRMGRASPMASSSGELSRSIRRSSRRARRAHARTSRRVTLERSETCTAKSSPSSPGHSTTARASTGSSRATAANTRSYRSTRVLPPKLVEISRMTSSSRFRRDTSATRRSIEERLRTTKEASTTGKNARSMPAGP